MERTREPGGRAPAPGGLRLVQAFINTNDIEAQQDELGSPKQVRTWLANQGLTSGDGPISDEECQRAVAVREALRSLALVNNGGTVDAAAVAALNEATRHAPLVVAFGTDGHAQLVPSGAGLDGALALILAQVVTAMTDGTWIRLKACRRDVCRWVYYDASKNRSGTWCTMAICGSRTKAHLYRQRQQAATR